MGDDPLIPLSMMMPGESAVLDEIRGLRHHQDGHIRARGPRRERRHKEPHLMTDERGHRLEHRLNYMGLVPGEHVRVVQNNPPGQMIIAVKGTRLGLSRGIASRLMMRPDTGEPL